MSRLTCPVCARRHATLVAANCVVCDGVGTLSLGPNVSSVAPPAVGALAVVLYLERAARRYSTEPYVEQPAHVEHAVALLRSWGILAGNSDEPTIDPPILLDAVPATDGPASERRAARTLAAAWGPETAPGDEQALTAPLLPHDQQRALQDASPGRFPPPHSKNGSRAHLARAVDQYAFTTNVTTTANTHQADERAAARLVHAFDQAGSHT